MTQPISIIRILLVPEQNAGASAAPLQFSPLISSPFRHDRPCGRIDFAESSDYFGSAGKLGRQGGAEKMNRLGSGPAIQRSSELMVLKSADVVSRTLRPGNAVKVRRHHRQGDARVNGG